MPQQEPGQAGEALPLPLPQGADIPGQIIPAVPLAQEAVFSGTGRGPAVAQVVVSAHGEAMSGQKAGKMVIAAHVLRDPVDQLHHGPGRRGGGPLNRMDGVEAVAGGEGKGLEVCHGTVTPFVVKWGGGHNARPCL